MKPSAVTANGMKQRRNRKAPEGAGEPNASHWRRASATAAPPAMLKAKVTRSDKLADVISLGFPAVRLPLYFQSNGFGLIC